MIGAVAKEAIAQLTSLLPFFIEALSFLLVLLKLISTLGTNHGKLSQWTMMLRNLPWKGDVCTTQHIVELEM